jgi:hypothetical protein
MEFQKIIDHPGIVWIYLLGVLAHFGLGRAYALQGDTAKSGAAYQDFLRLWKDACLGIEYRCSSRSSGSVGAVRNHADSVYYQRSYPSCHRSKRDGKPHAIWLPKLVLLICSAHVLGETSDDNKKSGTGGEERLVMLRRAKDRRRTSFESPPPFAVA